MKKQKAVTKYDYTLSFKWSANRQSFIKAKWQDSEKSAIEWLKNHMNPHPVYSIEVTHKEISMDYDSND